MERLIFFLLFCASPLQDRIPQTMVCDKKKPLYDCPIQMRAMMKCQRNKVITKRWDCHSNRNTDNIIVNSSSLAIGADDDRQLSDSTW